MRFYLAYLTVVTIIITSHVAAAEAGVSPSCSRIAASIAESAEGLDKQTIRGVCDSPSSQGVAIAAAQKLGGQAVAAIAGVVGLHLERSDSSALAANAVGEIDWANQDWQCVSPIEALRKGWKSEGMHALRTFLDGSLIGREPAESTARKCVDHQTSGRAKLRRDWLALSRMLASGLFRVVVARVDRGGHVRAFHTSGSTVVEDELVAADWLGEPGTFVTIAPKGSGFLLFDFGDGPRFFSLDNASDQSVPVQQELACFSATVSGNPDFLPLLDGQLVSPGHSIRAAEGKHEFLLIDDVGAVVSSRSISLTASEQCTHVAADVSRYHRRDLGLAVVADGACPKGSGDRAAAVTAFARATKRSYRSEPAWSGDVLADRVETQRRLRILGLETFIQFSVACEREAPWVKTSVSEVTRENPNPKTRVFDHRDEPVDPIAGSAAKLDKIILTDAAAYFGLKRTHSLMVACDEDLTADSQAGEQSRCTATLVASEPFPISVTRSGRPYTILMPQLTDAPSTAHDGLRTYTMEIPTSGGSDYKLLVNDRWFGQEASLHFEPEFLVQPWVLFAIGGEGAAVTALTGVDAKVPVWVWLLRRITFGASTGYISRPNRNGGTSQLLLLATSLAVDIGFCEQCYALPRGAFIRPRIGIGSVASTRPGGSHGLQLSGEFGLGYRWNHLEFEALTLLDSVRSGEDTTGAVVSFGARATLLRLQ